MSRTKAIAFSALGGAFAAVFTANIAFADGRFGGGFGSHRRGDGVFLFFPLLMLIALGALLVLLWRGRHNVAPIGAPPAPPSSASPTFNAQAILADRLARGEISPDDYRAAITVLREPPPPPPVG
jgi:uncharacterized membrane protein